MYANPFVPSFSAGRARATTQFPGGSDGNGWGKRPRSGGNERRG